MRKCAIICCTSLWWINVGLAQDAVQKEQEKLQGTWQVLRQEYDGDDENFQDNKLVITADKITFKEKQGEKTWTYKLDPAKQPKTIDLTTEVKGKTIQWTGIYQLNGDTLRICASEKGKDRPTEFTCPKGSRLTLYVLKRVKP
jgi:uncharacterized protein (TIGR03067 family)